MRTYNKHKAIKLYKDFKQLTKVNVFNRSKQTKIMALRSLFFKVLQDYNFMNDREIAEFFAEMGDKRNRSGIFTSLTKMEQYYLNFDFFKDIYDLYFYDSKEHQRKYKLSKQQDKLDNLIDTVEDESRRDELYEMVNLRIKSWSWKVEDRCEIISCAI